MTKIHTKSSAIAMRSAARLMAVQATYQSFTDDKDIRLIANEFLSYRNGIDADGDKMVEADRELFTGILQGVKERRDDLETLVSANRGGEEKKPLEPILQSIALCGAYELLTHSDIDVGIIINDYVNVAHSFYEGKEPSLINGLLDSIGRVVR